MDVVAYLWQGKVYCSECFGSKNPDAAGIIKLYYNEKAHSKQCAMCKETIKASVHLPDISDTCESLSQLKFYFDTDNANSLYEEIKDIPSGNLTINAIGLMKAALRDCLGLINSL